MIVVLSDTHHERGTGLKGRAATAVEAADRVVHVGDFTTEHVLSAYQEVTSRFEGVHGNSDSQTVTDRLPADRILRVGNCRVAVTHHREGGSTGLALWGRAQDADLVLHGHTHRAAVEKTGDIVLCNPGSHAAPRGGQATHAELVVRDDGLDGTIVRRDAVEVAAFEVTGGYK